MAEYIKTCPVCGFENEAAAMFCKMDGLSLAEIDPTLKDELVHEQDIDSTLNNEYKSCFVLQDIEKEDEYCIPVGVSVIARNTPFSFIPIPLGEHTLIHRDKHCRLIYKSEEKKLYAIDESKRNGIFVNGDRVKKGNVRELKAGDVLSLGDGMYLPPNKPDPKALYLLVKEVNGR